MSDLRDVTPLLEPNEDVVRALEKLLEAARSGELRGILFVVFRQGNNYTYGAEGAYSLGDYALAIKLMELELDSIATHSRESDDG